MGELGEMKSLMSSIRADFDKRFSALEDKITNNYLQDITPLKASIDKLQNDFKEFSKSFEVKAQNDVFEEVFQEFNERVKRKHNLILFGVTEQQSANKDDRVSADKTVALDILRLANISTQNINNLRAIRLGRFSEDRSRPIKVILENEEQVYQVIRNVSVIKNTNRFKNISISLDRTPK